VSSSCLWKAPLSYAFPLKPAIRNGLMRPRTRCGKIPKRVRAVIMEEFLLEKSGLKLGSLFAYSAVALTLDQLLKHWVSEHMQLHFPSIPLVQGYFALTYTRNYGSAWSMLWGQRGLLIAIASAVALGIVIYAVRLKDRSWLQMAGLGFLLGGALGNLIDRARLGYVVDMFDVQQAGHNIFPIFNVADMCIDLGVGLLLLFTFLLGRREKREAELAGGSNVLPFASKRAP
jgi:signal peptidase II